MVVEGNFPGTESADFEIVAAVVELESAVVEIVTVVGVGIGPDPGNVGVEVGPGNVGVGVANVRVRVDTVVKRYIEDAGTATVAEFVVGMVVIAGTQFVD
ncbi:hypothetical protein AAHE18_20G088200 [Arachis hypogaea]